MKRRWIAILLTVCMLLSAFPCSIAASAEETESTEETTALWSYELIDGAATLTGYNGTATDVYVPGTVEENGTDYPVTKLGDSLFENNDALNSVTLAAGILEIGAKAFYECDNLVCALISEELTTIGDEAFYSCDVMNSIILYDAVTAIGENAFGECPKLTVWCNEGSTGYTYAVAQGIPYKLLGGEATYEDVVLDGITYYLADGEATVFSFDKSVTEVTIRAYVNGLPVTKIANAFDGCTNLISVSLPHTLKSINQYAFRNCTSLISVNIPESVTSIGMLAFYGCKKLQTVGNTGNVSTIGKQAFDGCTALGSFTFSERLQLIDEYTFNNCASLTSVRIPGSVAAIGKQAFEGCSSLAELVLEDGIQTIGHCAFVNSPIQQVYIPASVTSMQAVVFSQNTVVVVEENSYAHTWAETNDWYFFVNNGVDQPEFPVIDGITYFVSQEEAIPFSCDPSITDAVIPETVNQRPVVRLSKVFYECSNLKSVVLPDTLKSIDGSAFYKCTALTNVTLPSGLEKIGEYTFYGCSALEEIEIPEGVKTIGTYAFAGCSKLAGISFPSTVTTIYDYAFSGCISIKELYIPETVKSAKHAAFYGCSGLETLTIATNIGGYETFYKCTSLKNVIFTENVTSLAGDMFMYCSSLESVDLPDGLTDLPSRIFVNCTSLKNITLPENVTKIGQQAFSYCERLESVTFPDGLQEIGNQAFRNCSKLQIDSLPKELVSIGDDAFYKCTSITQVTIPEKTTKLGERVFDSCTNLKVAVLPASLKTMYTSTFPVSTLLFVKAGSKAETFAINNNLMYMAYEGDTQPAMVTLEGVTYCVGEENAVAISCDTTLTEVTLPETVNGVPLTELAGAFRNCTKLTKVTLPARLEIIGKEAFYGCKVLSGIDFPDSVTLIGESAFYGCVALESVEFSGNIASIGSYAFHGCTKLKAIEIPETVSVIQAYSFASCTSLTELLIPKTVETIEEYAFSGCSGVTEIRIEEGVTFIGPYAFSATAISEIVIPKSIQGINLDYGVFYNCKKLACVELPEGLRRLPSSAFRGCISLESIELPSTLNQVFGYAFQNCDLLKSVVIPDSVYTIGSYTFEGCDNLENVILPKSISTIEQSAFTNCPKLKKLVIPENLKTFYSNSFSSDTVLMVIDGSYAATYLAQNNLRYVTLKQAENPEIAYGAELSGTVTYTDGTAAAGATVEIFYDDGTLKESVAVAEDGSYTFTYAEVGAYTIRVTDADGNTATTQVSVKRMNVFDVFVAGDTALTLKKGWTVSGTVGEAATVTVTDQEGNTIASVTTEDGTFSFANIPNGTYIVKAETENGSVAQEITVFDGNVTDLTLTVLTGEVTIWGYVEVEDRDHKHHRRNWVRVTLHNEEGVAIAQCKSDREGKYTFANLPVGEYTVVAETAEMRPDKKHGYDRSHTLTGYGYIDAAEAGTYEAETIILYEENDGLATISGKATAQGENQKCEVILRDVFRHEVAAYTTGNNGKYTFKNVKDGLYFITATTESDGMGYAIVAVRHGEVYGDTDITVFKSDKIKDRHQKFKDDVPDCNNREEALQHKDRIAEEKRFYDGLSEKERKQLPKDYSERLNRYAEWIAEVEYTAEDGVSVEGGGLVVSGDELENENSITFNLSVEKVDAPDVSTDGVHNRDDFIHHSVRDTADEKELQQYYEISMTKTVDGKEKAITSVYKDTDACGKFRITLPIPEEYRGYKHYSVIHVHCGEAVTLTDLDDDPDTVTFEVDRFSTFVLSATNTELTEVVEDEVHTCSAYAIAEGKLVCAECGEEKAYTGMVEIGSEVYYAKVGVITGGLVYVTATVGEYAEGYYLFTEAGKIADEVIAVWGGQGFCYIVNGQPRVAPGFVEYNGNRYYVKYGGKIAIGLTYIVEENAYYLFGENGAMVDEQVAIWGGQGPCYIVDGQPRVAPGFVEFSGNRYYVKYGGKIAIGLTYIVEENAYYLFGENGAMVDEQVAIWGGQGPCYIVDGQPRVAPGFVEFNGNYYYVKYGGKIAIGLTYIVEENAYYLFGENGAMVDEQVAIWGGQGPCYIVDGQPRVAPGFVEFNGNYYYVKYGGKVATDSCINVGAGEILAEGTYYADADGVLTAE